jgi:hypothetical protein
MVSKKMNHFQSCGSSLYATLFRIVMDSKSSHSQTEQLPKIKVSEDGLVVKQILLQGSGISPSKGDIVTSNKRIVLHFLESLLK